MPSKNRPRAQRKKKNDSRVAQKRADRKAERREAKREAKLLQKKARRRRGGRD